MSTSHMRWFSFHLCAKNFHSWWKFDKVMTKIILHSFLRHGRCCGLDGDYWRPCGYMGRWRWIDGWWRWISDLVAGISTCIVAATCLTCVRYLLTYLFTYSPLITMLRYCIACRSIVTNYLPNIRSFIYSFGWLSVCLIQYNTLQHETKCN